MAALVALAVVAVALGAALSGGLVATAPAGPQIPPPPSKPYDPLP